MRYEDYNRGTKTGKTYTYADCLIWWSFALKKWVAFAPGTEDDIATAAGIKPMRDILFNMKIKKEGPWAKPSES